MAETPQKPSVTIQELETITGTVILNELELDLVRTVESFAKSVGTIMDSIEERARGEDAPIRIDKRWLAIAKTDLQRGFMSLRRSIARPKTF